MDARELIEALEDSGTGSSRLERMTAWVDAQPEEPDGQQLLEWMMSSETQEGTIRKAGKMLHGDAWEYYLPGTAPQTPTEEVKLLRAKLTERERYVKELEMRNAGIVRENGKLRSLISNYKAEYGALERIQASEAAPAKTNPVRITETKDDGDDPDL